MEEVVCSQCQKTPDLCVCSAVKPRKTQIHTLILRHPQDPDQELGTGLLTHLALENSTLRTGLSWPNLRAARYGKGEGGAILDPKRWAVLYLGSGIKGNRPDGAAIIAVDRNGKVLEGTNPMTESWQGLVVIDGTWSQAKTLWWRNPWIIKLRRLILAPREKSLYGKYRREPRKECLSTIESAGLALSALEKDPKIASDLKALLGELVGKFETRAQIKNQAKKKPSGPN